MTVGLSQEPLDSVVELVFSNYLLISHITGRLIRTASGHTCNSNTSMRIPPPTSTSHFTRRVRVRPTHSPLKKSIKDHIMGELLIQRSGNNVELVSCVVQACYAEMREMAET
jgi:hypothetical protein